MKLTTLLTATVVATSSSLALAERPPFTQCSEQFYEGFIPKTSTAHPGKQRDLCFDGFAVLHSGVAKTPVFVAEYLTRDTIHRAKQLARTDKFYEEARLPSADRALLSDYKGSGYDRGHLAAAGQRATATGMAQSFSLANMVPQDPNHNRGPWSRSVENPTRQYALRATAGIYVFTGPIYKKPVKTIGSGVWVPTALFKLVYDPARKTAWGFELKNEPNVRVTRKLSYEEIVSRTGIVFLPPGAILQK